MFRAAVFSRARRNAHAVNAQIVFFFSFCSARKPCRSSEKSLCIQLEVSELISFVHIVFTSFFIDRSTGCWAKLEKFAETSLAWITAELMSFYIRVTAVREISNGFTITRYLIFSLEIHSLYSRDRWSLTNIFSFIFSPSRSGTEAATSVWPSRRASNVCSWKNVRRPERDSDGHSRITIRRSCDIAPSPVVNSPTIGVPTARRGGYPIIATFPLTIVSPDRSKQDRLLNTTVIHRHRR